ncbi:MAG TPA: DNA replication and repair protein RecF [Patescibacteria group bacterium]|nr:DNA replication and repair protein RecF [Patescibacteria group bacterium]
MITDLRLQNFRSYADASFELGQAVNIIVGPNASGKTNILEAILVLASGSSYRAHDAELVQFDASWTRLDATTSAGTRTVKLQPGEAGKVLKTFDIDGQKFVRLSAQRKVPAVLFEPNHLFLLNGPPEPRRAFLDDLLEQINVGFGATRRHYKRVLYHRNTLLKQNPPNIADQLFVWNLRLSELAGKLAKDRRALISRFEPQMSELYNSLTLKNHDIGLEYVTRFAGQDYETALLRKLEASTELDILRGFTAYGPHRDDLQLSIDGHPASESASRGETRTLVLALKILELKVLEESCGQSPLLLLDDVFSELDTNRRQALTKFINQYQTLITTTDADLVAHYFSSCNIITLPANQPL